MRTHRIALVLIVASLLSSSTAVAYQLETCGLVGNRRWSGGSVMLAGEETTLSADDISAIKEAMNVWNQSSANFTFSYTKEQQDGFTWLNSRNEIARATNNLHLGDSAAVAVWAFDFLFTCHMTEADIYIDGRVGNNKQKTSIKNQSIAYGGSIRPLTGLLVHELGHVLGLMHEPDVYNIMGQDYTCVNANGDTLFFDVGADATLGAAVLYGLDPSVIDVSAVHWERTGTTDDNGDGFADGVYSKHERTRVTNSQGVELPRVVGPKDVEYKVREGATIRVGFTYENLGAMPVTPDLDFYISDNDSITLHDTHLAHTSVPLAPYGSMLLWHTLQLPAHPPVFAPHTVHSAGMDIFTYVGPVLTLASDSQPNNNATYVKLLVMNNGDVDYCSNQLCKLGEGPCTSSARCVAGTTCQTNAGATFGLDGSTSVCTSYCSSAAPCQAGEGHCFDRSGCAPGLVCTTVFSARPGSTAKFNVCELPKNPDLVVTSLTHNPPAPTNLSTITFSAVVKNQGGVTALPSSVRLTIGGETTGVLLDVVSLAPGQSATVQRTATLSSGSYTYRATADARGAIAEFSETNNERTSTVTVTLPQPDLVVSSLACTSPGGTVTITATVSNTGNAPAPASTLKVTVPLGLTSIAVPALAAGQSSTQSLSITPKTLGTSAQCTATADSSAVVAESSETNNSRSAPVMIY